MNPVNDPLIKLREILTQKNSGVICLPENPTTDSIASTTALYQGLIKLGKNITIVCSSSIKADTVGADKIQSSLTSSGDNLVISLPYTEGAIDKVDYSIQGDRFNLLIVPHEGSLKIKSDDVQYSYSGGTVDFIITVDATSLKNLGKIYLDNQKQFEDSIIINIDRHVTNNFFGKVNLVNKTFSSTSEIILTILKSLKCEIDRDIATSLYAGLVAATNNFTSYSVNAETFQTAATLLKLGATKKSQNKSVNNNSSVGLEKDVVKTIESVEKETAPEDWLKPKIFRSSGDIV